MYAPFFGLKREPFSIAPDPRFLFMSAMHREALAHLLYGVNAGGGFVLLTGEIGAGKTTVCRCFLEQVPKTVSVAYVFNPQLSVRELLQTICAEFGLPPVEDADSVKAHVDALNRFLLAEHAQRRAAVLVIDEAQNLSPRVLEQLRLLTNLETHERKLLQIILIGQPELREVVAQPGMKQLAQRIIARYHLGPLAAPDTAAYVRHRLAVAGPNAPLPFEPAALERIHRLSGGVPRRINLLADRAMLGAYSLGSARIDARIVEQAAREVSGETDPLPGATGRRRLRWAAAALGLLALGAAAGLGGGWWMARQQPAALAAAATDTPAVAPGPADSPMAAPGARPAAPGASEPAGAAASAASAPAVPTQVMAVAAPAAAQAPAPETAAEALLAAATADPGLAWRELGLRFGVAIGEGEPCSVVRQAGLACYRSTAERSAGAGGLLLVRQLDRPVVLVLRASATPTGAVAPAPRHAVLVGLGEQHAVLRSGGQTLRVTLPALASVWRGEFGTFWRLPPGGADVDTAAGRAWAEAQLAAAGYPGPGRLRERVAAFQLASGLPPDGRTGPLTLMSLNRVAAVDEPVLERR